VKLSDMIENMVPPEQREAVAEAQGVAEKALKDLRKLESEFLVALSELREPIAASRALVRVHAFLNDVNGTCSNDERAPQETRLIAGLIAQSLEVAAHLSERFSTIQAKSMSDYRERTAPDSAPVQ